MRSPREYGLVLINLKIDIHGCGFHATEIPMFLKTNQHSAAGIILELKDSIKVIAPVTGPPLLAFLAAVVHDDDGFADTSKA